MTTPSCPLEKIIETASRMIAALEGQALQDERFAELSMRQVFYLSTILELENPTFSDLAHELKVTKPSVTAIVGTLIQKGYVQKIQDAEDRRIYHIVATSKAREFSDLHEAAHKRMAAFLSANLDGDEIEMLARLMDKALRGSQE